MSEYLLNIFFCYRCQNENDVSLSVCRRSDLLQRAIDKLTYREIVRLLLKHDIHNLVKKLDDSL